MCRFQIRLLTLGLAALALPTLNSCSLAPPPPAPLHVQFSESARLHYQGNSGLMMASIGVMGTAIGVAIDEGIAKDMVKALQSAGYEPQQLLRDCFASLPKTPINTGILNIRGYAIIRQGEHYGWQITGDLTQATAFGPANQTAQTTPPQQSTPASSAQLQASNTQAIAIQQLDLVRSDDLAILKHDGQRLAALLKAQCPSLLAQLLGQRAD